MSHVQGIGQLLLVWCGLCIAGLSASGQDLPLSWREKVAGATSAEMADGLLIAQYKSAAAKQVLAGRAAFHISIDEEPLTITNANAAALANNLEAQIRHYEQLIQDRGYRTLPEAFHLETSGDCSPFEFVSGPVLMSQSGCYLTLWHKGVGHRGVIVESTVAFEHNRSAEIRFGGQIADGAVSANFRAIGFAKSSRPPGCTIRLTPAKELGPKFGWAFFHRAVTLLDADDYEHASVDLDRAIELNPKLDEALFLRSQLRSVSPDARFLNGTLAIADAEQACELTDWKHWQCLAPLACAYAEAGDFDKAIRTMEKAVSGAPVEKQRILSDAIEQFRRKEPMRYALHTHLPTEPVAEPGWVDLPEKPGVEIRLAADRTSTGVKLYRVQTNGLPGGSRYRIWMKHLIGDWTEWPGPGVIGTNGELAIERDGVIVPMAIVMSGFQKGETATMVLVSEDGKHKVTFKYAPRPLSAYDGASGYCLEAELLDAAGNFYFLTAKGFGDEESVKLYISQLGADKETCLGELNLKHSGDSTPIAIATGVYGKTGDIARVRFVGKKGEIRLDLPWGDRLVVARPRK